MGVWIETRLDGRFSHRLCVTPCMGVWIETGMRRWLTTRQVVTPCMGVWIETSHKRCKAEAHQVTPCMGVWIETYIIEMLKATGKSHPVWVCGLKQALGYGNFTTICHTLYVCVD